MAGQPGNPLAELGMSGYDVVTWLAKRASGEFGQLAGVSGHDISSQSRVRGGSNNLSRGSMQPSVSDEGGGEVSGTSL